MINMLKKFAAAVILTLMLLMLSGCYDKIEIENLGVVRMTGIDWDSTSNKYEATILVQRPFAGGTSTMRGVSTGNQIPWIASAEGDSVMDAFKNLRARASSSLSWHHSTILVIGEAMANQGIDKFIDFFARNREIRYTTNVFVTEGKASDIMKITPETQSNLADEIDGIIKNSKYEWNNSYVPDLKELLIDLSYKDHSPILGLIKAVKPTPFDFQENEEISGMKPSTDTVAIEGASIIKDYKLAGWFDAIEARGYRWIKGDISRAIVNVFNKGSIIGVQFNNAESKTDIDIKNNQIFINIKTKATGYIVEVLDKDKLISENGIEEIQKLAADNIKNEMLTAINKAKAFDADIFGFGRKIRETNPDKWKIIGRNWDDYFKEVQVSIEVKTNIKSVGMTSEPITKLSK